MNEDIGKFLYDSVQQRTKRQKNHENDLTIRTFIIWQGRILQSDWSIRGPDFAVMPSAAVAGHYEIFNALQNKTEQNSENTSLFFKKCKSL